MLPEENRLLGRFSSRMLRFHQAVYLLDVKLHRMVAFYGRHIPSGLVGGYLRGAAGLVESASYDHVTVVGYPFIHHRG